MPPIARLSFGILVSRELQLSLCAGHKQRSACSVFARLQRYVFVNTILSDIFTWWSLWVTYSQILFVSQNWLSFQILITIYNAKDFTWKSQAYELLAKQNGILNNIAPSYLQIAWFTWNGAMNARDVHYEILMKLMFEFVMLDPCCLQMRWKQARFWVGGRFTSLIQLSRWRMVKFTNVR